jgi:hypothetical protein
MPRVLAVAMALALLLAGALASADGLFAIQLTGKELEALPDKAARTAARAGENAIDENDAATFLALVADDGVTVAGRLYARAEVKKALAKTDVRTFVSQGEAKVGVLYSQKNPPTYQWKLAVDPAASGRFRIWRQLSDGDPPYSVLVFARQHDDTWKLVRIVASHVPLQPLPQAELDALPDEGARTAALALVDLVEHGNEEGFLRLLPSAGVKVAGTKRKPAAVKQLLATESLDWFIARGESEPPKREPGVVYRRAPEEVRWTVAAESATRLVVVRWSDETPDGAGRGLVLARQKDKSWKLVEIRDMPPPKP